MNTDTIGMNAGLVWNALNDPTTAGFGDSNNALTYTEPKK